MSSKEQYLAKLKNKNLYKLNWLFKKIADIFSTREYIKREKMKFLIRTNRPMIFYNIIIPEIAKDSIHNRYIYIINGIVAEIFPIKNVGEATNETVYQYSHIDRDETLQFKTFSIKKAYKIIKKTFEQWL